VLNLPTEHAGAVVKGATFYHMGPLPATPLAVRHFTLEKRKGGMGTRLWIEDVAGLLGLADKGGRDPPVGCNRQRHRASRHAGLWVPFGGKGIAWPKRRLDNETPLDTLARIEIG
jgi:hypothetical protein